MKRPRLKLIELFMLATLGGKDRHGLGVMQRVERITDGSIRIAVGTLYRTLATLERKGLVVRTATPDGEDPRRQYHRLTRRGRSAVNAELRALEGLLSVLRREMEARQRSC